MTALETWKAKLDYLQRERALASSAAQRFELDHQIAEAEGFVKGLLPTETISQRQPGTVDSQSKESGDPKSFRFEVAFSFAGPHREKVKEIAEHVAAQLGRDCVFFDEWYEHEILGGDMDVLLQRIYLEQSLMVVADLSDDYAGRPWCQSEARAIRALRFQIDSARDQTARLRLLNARLGDGKVPGILPTEGYLDGVAKTAEQCAEIILRRHALLY